MHQQACEGVHLHIARPRQHQALCGKGNGNAPRFRLAVSSGVSRQSAAAAGMPRPVTSATRLAACCGSEGCEERREARSRRPRRPQMLIWGLAHAHWRLRMGVRTAPSVEAWNARNEALRASSVALARSSAT